MTTRRRASRAVGFDFSLPQFDPTSYDPRAFDVDEDGESFSVTGALRSNYGFYADSSSRESGAKDFTLSACPQSIRDSLDAIQARTFHVGSSPSIFALTYCALEHGLQALNGEDDLTHPAIAALTVANEVQKRAVWPDRHTRRVVSECARAAYLDTAAPGGPTRRWNIRLPREFLRDLGGLASDLGISKSATAVLCLQVALASQAEDLEDQRAEYAAEVEGFLRRVQLRADIITALVEKLAIPARGRKRGRQ